MNKLKFLKNNPSLITNTKFSFGQNYSLYKQSIRYFAINLNIFNKKTNNTNGKSNRLTELQNKLNHPKNINDKDEQDEEEKSINQSREEHSQKVYDRFLKFLENKDSFTWQNNLELIKVI